MGLHIVDEQRHGKRFLQPSSAETQAVEFQSDLPLPFRYTSEYGEPFWSAWLLKIELEIDLSAVFKDKTRAGENRQELFYRIPPLDLVFEAGLLRVGRNGNHSEQPSVDSSFSSALAYLFLEGRTRCRFRC